MEGRENRDKKEIIRSQMRDMEPGCLYIVAGVPVLVSSGVSVSVLVPTPHHFVVERS